MSCYTGEGETKLGLKSSNHNWTEGLGKQPFNFEFALYNDGRGESYWKMGTNCLTPSGLIRICAHGLAMGLQSDG